ncbi:F0F1 ATP synthase subunit B family protein [Streptomyces sp. AN091965]|uniref:F0F1 ATP synthase subunit B family protein n=1 Tax=Streptomyces sp. AN091965 TaxID=2927803 RepID=UPI001F607EA2|nr:hypothetical protein [Streptomyces sp. AN091965]MCI3930255.1 hypothetical protein [Streptomyces sp. AN091965]
MDLLALELGPLRPRAVDLLLGGVLFAAVFWAFAGVLLPRLTRTLAERERLTEGRARAADAAFAEAARAGEARAGVLADARHEAALTRQRAMEEGTEAIRAAREAGLRERDQVVAAGTARVAAERAAARAELEGDARHLAARLAERIVGEPLGAATDR